MCVKHVVSSFLDHSWWLDFIDKDRQHLAKDCIAYQGCVALEAQKRTEQDGYSRDHDDD